MSRTLTGAVGNSLISSKLLFAMVAFAMMTPLTGWTAEYDAVLDWNRKAKLSTPVSGVVAKVNVRPGDRVIEGDVLLQLDNGVIKANVEKAKADVQHYERLYKEAERELERHQELYDRTVLSDHELELAHIAFAQATAQLRTAEAALAKVEFDLRHSEIKAPFDGIVILRQVNEGETIVSSDTPPLLIEVAEADVMITSFQVTGGQLGRFKNGKKATVSVGGNQYAGEVSAVGFEPVSKSGNKYLINVRFNTKGRLLRAGRAAKVNVP
ncbi:efflux RND transporter periplasmic adaptor subunit [Kaarinaea lacus]